jgi:purine-binding chemotaxis protein CheW
MSDETQARQLVVFTLGAEQYALPIEQVHEIIRYDEPRSVASPISWVRGVISLRGRIVPVYDLAARLGVNSELSDQTKIVIVESGEETAGVIVDEVEEVLTVEEVDFEEVPGADSDLIESIAKLGDRLVVLLKPSTIFVGIDELVAQAA